MNIWVKWLELFSVPRTASSVTPAVSREEHLIKCRILCKGFFKIFFNVRRMGMGRGEVWDVEDGGNGEEGVEEDGVGMGGGVGVREV